MPDKCFAPGCKTGYAGNPVKIRLFKARGESERASWAKRIPRKDRIFGLKDYICALHFEEEMIDKDHIYIINGEEVRMSRTHWKLKENALPTQ